MASVAELRAQAEALLLQAEQQESVERTKTFDAFIKKLGDGGYELDDFISYARPKKVKGKILPAKYAGPNGEKYSGNGRKPKWLIEALESGKKLEDFLIKV